MIASIVWSIGRICEECGRGCRSELGKIVLIEKNFVVRSSQWSPGERCYDQAPCLDLVDSTP